VHMCTGIIPFPAHSVQLSLMQPHMLAPGRKIKAHVRWVPISLTVVN
jgi:hypothetical protein